VVIALQNFRQVVVLSRIIPDEEPAVSSAEGIKTIVDRLAGAKDDNVRAVAADCIARLAHTRAGGVACLQNVTVFEKQVVSTVATPIKGSVCQSIATDFPAYSGMFEV